MNKEHHVIVIPGLGDGEKQMQFVEKHWNWQKYGLRTTIYPVHWHDGQDFELKLTHLTRLISTIRSNETRVSIIGTSAGGSAALNVFCILHDDIHRVVNVCGRLRKGPNSGLRSFTLKTQSSPAFAQSVILFQRNEASLLTENKRKIMTIHSKYGDELVPAETTTISGARNITVPVIEHGLSIIAAMTIFSQPIIEFLMED